MADIIVTTPLTRMTYAAQEAKNCIAEGGGEYFRNLGKRIPKDIKVGDRIFYVEAGAVRGYCLISSFKYKYSEECATTGEIYTEGFYVYADATTWKWISPIPFKGFQGWRYSVLIEKQIKVLGDWLQPRPSGTLKA